MNSPLLEFLRNIYFWIFVLSLIGGFLSLRLANSNRDQAAFADFPDKPEKYIFRARLLYGLSFVFIISVLSGIVIFSYQFLQINRPEISLDLSKIASAVNQTPVPTEVLGEEDQPIIEETDESEASVPSPTPVEEVMPTPVVSGEIAVASIGNTNFLGVNVRERPTLNGEIIAKLINQTEVYVFDEPKSVGDGYTWRKVRLEKGEIGWIAEPFLIFISGSSP